MEFILIKSFETFLLQKNRISNCFSSFSIEFRTWTEGEIMVFDDSFEHEVWHNGTTYRLILIVDVWHPDLTAHEKKSLVPI